MKKFSEVAALTLMFTATTLIFIVIASIFITTLIKGLPALNKNLFSFSGELYSAKSGIMNAVAGSLLVTILSTLIASIIGIPAAFYLNLSMKGRKARFIRFIYDVMIGIPSIIYGASGFAVMLITGMPASLAAAIATLSILILPIVLRGADEVIKTFPVEVKEAVYSIGGGYYNLVRMILKVEFEGLLSAILISSGRAFGDAASVLMTAGYSNVLSFNIFSPVATLPIAVFYQLFSPLEEIQTKGYASSFILLIISFLISFVSHFLRRKIVK